MNKRIFPVVLCIFGVVFGYSTLRSASADPVGQISAQDRIDILDLISRYSHTWDSKDSIAWAALFTDSAIWQIYLAGEPQRASNKAERLSGAKSRHAMFTENGVQTRHFQTNTLLTQHPNGSVNGETVFFVTWQHAAEDTPRLMHTGIYRDEYTKTPSGWRFSRREVRLDHE